MMTSRALPPLSREEVFLPLFFVLTIVKVY